MIAGDHAPVSEGQYHIADTVPHIEAAQWFPYKWLTNEAPPAAASHHVL